MGLDMYLSRKTYVKNWDHMEPSAKHQITVLKDGKPRTDIKPERISYIVEEVAYWRKANAIHAWFVNEVQKGVDECQESYVEVEKLKELVDMCKTILAAPKTKRRKVAEELLPPQSGFFFGSTEVDEYYFEDLQQTIKMLEPLLGYTGGEYYYRASW